MTWEELATSEHRNLWADFRLKHPVDQPTAPNQPMIRPSRSQEKENHEQPKLNALAHFCQQDPYLQDVIQSTSCVWCCHWRRMESGLSWHRLFTQWLHLGRTDDTTQNIEGLAESSDYTCGLTAANIKLTGYTVKHRVVVFRCIS